MNRTQIIKTFLGKFDKPTYLEIGVEGGINFNAIDGNIIKYGVDPDPRSKATHVMTSDRFFEVFSDLKFDVIFIDGLHHASQVYKDARNAMDRLNPCGAIIFHDMLPTCEVDQIIPQANSYQAWTGDCWKAWTKLRSEIEDWSMHVVNTDWGCGIMTRGTNDPIIIPNRELAWNDFQENKEYYMNIISVEEFRKLHD